MAIKMIAADLDDTLLDPHGKITERTKAAVSEAMRRGVIFVPASGRMPEAMRAIAEDLNINGAVIAFNGALTTDLFTGRDVVRLPVENTLAREAARMAEDRGAHVQLYKDGTYYYKEENIYAERYAKALGMPGHAVGETMSEWFTGDADKILIVNERENVAVWVEEFRQHFEGRLNCAISKPTYIEIFNCRADKGEALKAYSESLGIRRDEVAAFGDGENDMSMIRFAGYGYVMANANVKLLAESEHAAPSNAEDGLARVLEYWFKCGMIHEV